MPSRLCLVHELFLLHNHIVSLLRIYFKLFTLKYLLKLFTVPVTLFKKNKNKIAPNAHSI